MRTPSLKSPEDVVVGPETQAEDLLKDDEFVKFLAKFEDFEVVAGKNDMIKMRERFEMFKQKEELAKDLRDFYRGDIKTDIGLELSDSDLKDVDAYVEKLVLTDAMQFRNFSNSFRLLKNNEAELAACKSKIDTYRAVDVKEVERDLDDAYNKVYLIQQAQESERLFGRTGKISRALFKTFTFGLGHHESDDVREMVADKKNGLGLSLDFTSLTKELKKAQAEASDKERRNSDREEFLKAVDHSEGFVDSLKQDIFDASDLSDKLAAVAKKVADAKFRELLTDPKHDEAITNRESEIVKKGKEQEEVNKSLVEKEVEISELQNQKDSISEDVKKLEAETDPQAKQQIAGKLQALKTTESELILKIEELEKEAERLRFQLTEKDKEVDDLKKQEIPKKEISEDAIAAAQKILEGIQSGTDSAYSEEIKPTDIVAMSNKIQNAVIEAVVRIIDETKIEKGGFNAMDKALKDLIGKGAIGSMTGAEVKKFLHDTFDRVLYELPKGQESNAKKILVRGLMYKHGLSKAA